MKDRYIIRKIQKQTLGTLKTDIKCKSWKQVCKVIQETLFNENNFNADIFALGKDGISEYLYKTVEVKCPLLEMQNVGIKNR